jgi:hypothetical protein
MIVLTFLSLSLILAVALAEVASDYSRLCDSVSKNKNLFSDE